MTTAAKGKDKPRKATWRSVAATAAAAVLLLAVALHQILIVVLAAALALLAGALVLRARWSRYRSGGRVAARKRRKYQGAATRREIRAKLSPRAARKRTRATCPGLHPSEADVVIGRVKGGQTIADTWAGSRLVYAPPQAIKTALTSCWAADVPGTAVLFSSRCDQHDHTYLARKARGRVWTLNADGEGGIPTDFAWPPVDGCEVRKTAMRRAGDLMAAAPHDPSGHDAHWDSLSKDMLQYLLKAARLLPGGTIMTVKRWASNPLMAGKAADVLSQHDPGWGEALVSMVSQSLNDERYWSAISNGVTRALAWLDDDVMEAAACPPPGEGINLREFIEDGTGTIYIIGADREHGSLAPYFAAFGAEAFHVARSVAEATPGRRLRRPFVIIADEAATIVPLPWDKITAVSSGYNIGVTACFQADSQITERWGEHRAKTIRTNFTVKIIAGGFTDHAELEALSAICGDVDTWHDGHADLRKERLFPVWRLRLLPDWHALVLHRNARPVEVEVTPVWKRRGYRRATPGDYPVFRPAAAGRPALLPSPQRDALTLALLYLVLLRSARLPLRALDPPRRTPIAPPYTPPAIAAEEVTACRT